MEEEIILEVIPIEIGEMYPSKEEHWYFKNDGLKNGASREFLIDYMKQEIKEKFEDCKAIIVLEKGKVLDIL